MNENYFTQQLQEVLAKWDPESFKQQITDCLNCAKKIAIFGAGQNGIKIADILINSNYKDLVFIDETPAKIGKSVHGIPVLTPIQAYEKFAHELTVIISIFNVLHSFSQSQTRFERYGWKALSFIQVGVALSKQFAPFYFIDNPQSYQDKIAELNELYSQMVDDESKAELLANLKFRFSLDFKYIANNPVPYFAYIKNMISTNCHFIDGGAFDGDTIRYFLNSANKGFSKITAFEPDPVNFSKLQTYAKSLAPHLQQKICIRPAGLWSHDVKLNFTANGTASSAFIANEVGTTDVTYVDSIVEPEETVILKLDVEGAEVEAIRGASNAFSRGKAIAAISVYHKVSDLWEIPKLINSINPGYRFGLQSHANDGIDLTLYAIPPFLLHSYAY